MLKHYKSTQSLSLLEFLFILIPLFDNFKPYLPFGLNISISPSKKAAFKSLLVITLKPLGATETQLGNVGYFTVIFWLLVLNFILQLARLKRTPPYVARCMLYDTVYTNVPAVVVVYDDDGMLILTVCVFELSYIDAILFVWLTKIFSLPPSLHRKQQVSLRLSPPPYCPAAQRIRKVKNQKLKTIVFFSCSPSFFQFSNLPNLSSINTLISSSSL